MNTKVPLSLTTSIADLPGVTRPMVEGFVRMGVLSLAHLVRHLPYRHEREHPGAPLAELPADHLTSAVGEVTETHPINYGKRSRFEIVIADDSGTLRVTWFNMPFLRHKIQAGDVVRVEGTTKRSRKGGLEMTNPSWKQATGDQMHRGQATAGVRLRPVYPATEGLTSQAIGRVMERHLESGLALIDDHLPDDVRKSRELPTLREAYRMLHFPEDEHEAGEGRRRLVYDELLLAQLGVALRRAHRLRTTRAHALPFDARIDERIRARIPFTLTPGQESVIADIARDLQDEAPANRLIQGDVGAGKTVVALYAMLMAIAGGKQAALMAPTELLAEQHFASITRLLEGSKVGVELLTGSLASADADAVRARIASGEAGIVVGTHALLSESTSFDNLAVVVIDEQHRFGVHQRALLRAQSGRSEDALDERDVVPHTLVMTATPIPRTLSLTVFADLDVSVLKGLPPGRSPIETGWYPSTRADEVYARVRARLERGQQAYVVVPAIETNDAEGKKGLRSVASMVKRLADHELSGFRVAGVHGKRPRPTRERVMSRFRDAQVDALVATTVIEVGVDVPNATVMVVEHADRFGLAQLHQLRGRVGRGDQASACYLIADDPTPDGLERLKALCDTNDGFEIAERDLALRGPGELIGARQSGAAAFQLAEFPRDQELLLLCRRDARAWVERSPRLGGPGEALLKKRLLKAHGGALDLSEIA
ncbi:MAG: ATP-dependent DNA helicase RecG [Planctomycetota bacterium]